MNLPRIIRLIVIAAFFSILVPSSTLAQGHAPTAFGQLRIKRAANFGLNLTLSLWIDGRQVDRLQIGRDFVISLPAGEHIIRAAVPERRTTEPFVGRFLIAPGKTTVLFAGWYGQELMVQTRL